MWLPELFPVKRKRTLMKNSKKAKNEARISGQAFSELLLVSKWIIFQRTCDGRSQKFVCMGTLQRTLL